MTIVKITQDKLGSLAENAEKMLRYGGKVMQCIDELQHEGGSEMGERNYMGDYRDMGMRYDDRYRDMSMRDRYSDGMGERNYMGMNNYNRYRY